ncbi:aminotransferase class IV [Tateyamaria sp.]|uniref:aminotransferase class IV n=1 Tax=Tateyamaria sp. TaxID=1929288 RepID=UPI003B21FF6D
MVTSDHGVLHGITRQTVLEMCDATGLATETRALPLAELLEADEVFLSSSGGGVIPVARVDDRFFSNGRAGPTALALRKRYFNWIGQDKFRTAVQHP